MNILDFPEAQAALEKARKAEAAATAELAARTTAAAKVLADARQAREAATAAEQAANLAALQERNRAAREEQLRRQWLATGGRVEDWPNVRERVITAAAVTEAATVRKPFTL